MITFPREPFHSLMCLEILQADIAFFETHVFVFIQKNYCLDLSEVLVVVRKYLLKRLRELLAILLHDSLLILEVVNDAPLHKEDAVFVKSSDELLSSIDLFLDVADGAIEEIQAILVLHVDLSDYF